MSSRRQRKIHTGNTNFLPPPPPFCWLRVWWKRAGGEGEREVRITRVACSDSSTIEAVHARLVTAPGTHAFAYA